MQTLWFSVVGYSGRDHSIMDALEEALDHGNGFPSGLYWFHRSDSPILPRVEQLLANARAVNIKANLIEAETFDELLPDVLLLINDLPDEITAVLNKHAPRLSDAPMPAATGRWPLLRTNALPLVSYPSLCRRIVCDIGGVKQVREAVSQADADVLAARRQTGVIAFGSDPEIRKAFGAFTIKEFDVHSIEARRLRYESAELGLLYDALQKAIARERPLRVERKSGRYIVIVDETQTDNESFASLRKAVSQLTGTVPNTTVKWAEGAWISLEYWFGKLWLTFEPTIWIERNDDQQMHDIAREFVRARLAGRFNPKWNDLLQAWSEIFTAREQEAEVRAFGIGDGVDAVFKISSTTAFSWRDTGQ